MKKIAMLAVALMLTASAFAASTLDGTYTFTGRTKNGTADLQGWNGNMTIQNNNMARTYKSADGKEEKFYIGTMKQQGDITTVTFTKAYKPEYVGNVHQNRMNMNGNTLTIESVDGTFKETWTKK